MILLAHQYSGMPLQLNHAGLGEAAAAAVQNGLLPLLAFGLQVPGFAGAAEDVPAAFYGLAAPLAALKAGLFVALNLADRQGDAQEGKRTLPVLLGRAPAGLLHLAATLGAYAALLRRAAAGGLGRWAAAGAAATAPLGLRTCHKVLQVAWRDEAFGGPAGDGDVRAMAKAVLLHSPLVVVGALLGALLDGLAAEGIASAGAAAAYALRPDVQVRLLSVYTFLLLVRLGFKGHEKSVETRGRRGAAGGGGGGGSGPASQPAAAPGLRRRVGQS